MHIFPQEVIKDFERNMADLVSVFLENVQAFLTQAREHENAHNEKVRYFSNKVLCSKSVQIG